MAAYSLLPWIVAQAEQAPEAPTDELSVALRLLVAVGIIVGSFVVGGLIARALRLPDFAFKIGLITFATVAAVAINIAGWPPKRGIDLSGGVVLVYEVDRSASKPEWMPDAIADLNTELNSGAGPAVEVRPAASGEIEIVAPEGFDPQQVERAVLALRRSDGLTLHRAGEPRTEGDKTVFTYAADRQQKDLDMEKLITAVARRINPGGVKELTIRQYGAEQLEVIIPEVEKREVEQIKKRISTSGLLEFRIAANEADHKEIIRAGNKTAGTDVYIGGKLVGRWVKMGPNFTLPPSARGDVRTAVDGSREILVRMDPFDVNGGYLDRATSAQPQGRPIVEFTFDSEGAQRFGQLTGQNLPDSATDFHRHLGIVLDNVMLSAPQINGRIGARGMIEGDFTQKDVDFLVDVLNAGSLPASLRPEPIFEQRISAQLGDDTIRKGSLAMLISTAAILLFMLVYYRASGLVADLAVTLNIVITVALMILIKAAFTLPGLAGLVLTVGMAVDANVLIYERMREEMARGASLRMAIRNGFERATRTIIDSNLTTLITAVVLYVIGTDQIKGFAVTLILGLLVSMFTAIFVSRVIFDVAEKKRWLTQLKMMQLVGHTNIDFIRWRTPAIAASVVIIAIGMAAAASRGRELLDIDFTGGSSVQLLFAKGKQQNITEVRKAVADLPDVAVSSMGENDLEFKIDTSEGDISKVESSLQEAFGDALQTYSMTFGDLAMIEPPKEESGAAGAEGAAGATGESKSDEQPAATPPNESKPEASTPDASKPVEPEGEKPADTPAEPPAGNDTPDAPDDAAAPASKPEEPAPEDSSQSSRGAINQGEQIQLAVLDVEQAIAALLVAQDSAAEAEVTPDKAEPDKPAPAAAPAAEDKPAASEPAATDEKAPADERPGADEKPAETAAETASSKPAPADSPAADTAAEDESTATESGSLVGGTRAKLEFPQSISHEPLAEMIKKQLADMKLPGVAFRLQNPDYQPGSDAPYGEWTLEIGLDIEQTRTLLASIQANLADTPVFPGSNQIGGKVAGDTQMMALYAMLASMLMIVLYVWVRFQNVVFGLAAVVALLHDVLVSVAFLAMSAYLSPYLGALLVDPFKISLAVVAALLTIVGFSINDTIVIFDRIREVRGKSPELTEEMLNLSVNQTLSRTILTSGTVFIASIILYVVGGPGIHAFAYTMVVGTIAGTYSSVYIAAPILLWLKRPATSGKQAISATGSLSSPARRASA